MRPGPGGRDAVERVHRRLLGLYPPGFRARFGPELESTFRSAWRAARAGGRARAAAFLARASADLLATAAAERRVEGSGSGRGGGWARDLRHAARGLKRRPGFTVAVVATVSLGIGANAAVFSLVDAVLLDPLPVSDPASLVSVYEALERQPWGGTSWPTFLELRDGVRTLTDLAVSTELDAGLRVGQASERATAGAVSGTWFGVLGLAPQLGRLLQPADEAEGAHVVVLGDALWRRVFGADPGVIGTSVELGGHAFTVVGVAPRGFQGLALGTVHDLWFPVVLIREVGGDGLWGADVLETRFLPFLSMVGRLAPGATPEAVAAELNVRHAALRKANGKAMEMPFADTPIRVVSARFGATAERRGDIVRFLSVPAVVALLTLAIACLNVALLLLVRASERRQEFAIRAALGAGRRQLARQVFAESLLIGSAGCAAGFAVAHVTLLVLQRFPLPGGIALDTLRLAPDARMLVFGIGLALGTALLFGSVPAWVATRPDVVDRLRRGSRNGRRESGRGRLVLLSGQIALCLTLLVGAGLFLRSLGAALRVDPGFDAENVAAASFSLRPHGYTRESAPEFFASVLADLEAAPGIASAAIAVQVPIEPRRMRMPISNEVVPEGNGTFGGGRFFLSVNIVAGRFFETLRIPVLAGRAFGAADGPSAPPVAVLSASAARELWPGEDPLGRQLQLVRGIGPGITVVGVVADITAHAVQEGPVPYVYVSARQHPQIVALERATLIARDGDRGRRAAAAIRAALKRRDATLPVFAEHAVAGQIDAVLVPQRLGATLLALFGAVALLVAAVGIYGVIAWAVARRRFEIGLRRALGARTGDVVRDVTATTLAAIGLGSLAGFAAAATLTRFVSGYLFGIRMLDPAAYAGAAALLAVTALVATFVPTGRATRVSPMEAIRGD